MSECGCGFEYLTTMRRRKAQNLGSEWDRIRQIIKVEEPVTVAQVHSFCRDLRIWQVDDVMMDMVRAGRIERHEGERETFTIT